MLLTESAWVEDQLHRMGKRSINIGIGIDHETYKPAHGSMRNETRLLVNAPRSGILWDLKGMETLGRALQLVLARMPEVQLVSYSSSKSGLPLLGTSVTHIAGPTDDAVADLLRSSACFVVASRHEGFCLPALEAMSCGCPVVATKAGGNEEFCADEVTCVLCDVGNSGQLADGILRVLTNPSFAQELRTNALHRARRYSWDLVIPSLIDALGLA